MLSRSSSTGVLPAVLLLALTRGVASASSSAVGRGGQPLYYFDPGTTSYCSWWVDNDGTLDCSSVPDEWFITLEDFLRWVSSLVPSKYRLRLHCVSFIVCLRLTPYRCGSESIHHPRMWQFCRLAIILRGGYQRAPTRWSNNDSCSYHNAAPLKHVNHY